MAEVKISALPAASTPLAGTEVLPIVQNGVTDKVSVANLTAGRAMSAASLTLTSTPLAATSGGTGFASYAVGDLLYASTTTALSKLADVATGNALISGGVGAAPSWGKIGLTTHVSGTLPVANGGTALTSYTANGIVYASSTSALATSSNLTFDGANMAIGGAIAAPVTVYNRRNITGAASSFGYLVNSTIQSDVTAAAYGYKSILGTQAASFTNSTLIHYGAEQTTIGAGSTAVTQIAFRSEATLIGASFNVAFQAENTAAVTSGKAVYAFVNNVNVATGGGTAWGWYGQGTAPNVFAGLTRFGSTVAPVNTVDITGSLGRGAPVTKTGDFTLAATENWVIVNQAGTTTVTLPAASSWTGREVMFKTITANTLVSASSNVVPLAGGAAGTAILAATAGKWATCVSDGTNWVIMQGN